MLSDTMIRRAMDHEHEPHRLVVAPGPGILALAEEQFQPASLDLTLGTEFIWYPAPLVAPRRGHVLSAMEDIERKQFIYLDAEEPESFTTATDVGPGGQFLVTPGMFVLATTAERVQMPTNLLARVEGRSSIGRKGLIIHATAGFIDPGFAGHITLEIANLNCRGIVLRAGMRICQLSFDRVEGRVDRPYGDPRLKSKYQGQVGVTRSRMGNGGT